MEGKRLASLHECQASYPLAQQTQRHLQKKPAKEADAADT